MDSRQTSPAKRRFYSRYIEAAQHTGHTLWDRANQATKGYVAYLAQALKNFVTKGTTEAVVFGYWAMFSLFPLVMLGVVLATLALGPASARVQVYRMLSQYIPGGGDTLIRENIEQAINQRSSFGFIGIITLTYGATGLFRNLQANLRRIFRDKKSRSLPIQILIGVIMMIGLAILTTASIIISAIFSAVQGELFHLPPVLLAAAGALIPLAINMIMFALMFRLVPRTKISWRSILPAALVGAFIWEMGKNLFGLYVANLANFGIVYGSLGTVIGLLTWTYLTGCIVSLCAEMAVATEDWRTEQPPAIAVTTPDLNKPANELPASAEGQVMNIETNDGRHASDLESAKSAVEALNEPNAS
ncbi:MAG: YihY/virulence factor BrkB family protein [Anaerolineae bacterium]|nr:YihY/virulence factor BrkB family protein [Anaerolineae bacterium]